MSCCESCAQGKSCEDPCASLPTVRVICADPSLVLTHDAVGRRVCAPPGSSSVPSGKPGPTYVYGCSPGYRWEDTHAGPRCIPAAKPIPNTSAGPSSAGPSLHVSASQPQVVIFENTTVAMTPQMRAQLLVDCAPLPWSPMYHDKIAKVVTARARVGQTDPDRLVSTALLEVYPVTREGVAIDWPNLPATASTCLLELRRLVGAVVDATLAGIRLQVATQRYGAAAKASGGTGR